jgi:hypothetical protein
MAAQQKTKKERYFIWNKGTQQLRSSDGTSGQLVEGHVYRESVLSGTGFDFDTLANRYVYRPRPPWKDVAGMVSEFGTREVPKTEKTVRKYNFVKDREEDIHKAYVPHDRVPMIEEISKEQFDRMNLEQQPVHEHGDEYQPWLVGSDV